MVYCGWVNAEIEDEDENEDERIIKGRQESPGGQRAAK